MSGKNYPDLSHNIFGPGYPEFRNNPFIQSLALRPKWTISAKDKMPLNMVDVLSGRQNPGGAYSHDAACLVTLPEIEKAIGTGSSPNLACWLDSLQDGYCILDIEPECPEDLRRKFMRMPYVYSELSMSGKGVHLAFPIPMCFEDYPAAKKKVALKDDKKYYEILLQHYVTFTGKKIDPPEPLLANTESFETFFESMCKIQKDVQRMDVDVTAEEPDIPLKDRILDYMGRVIWNKTPAMFGNDLSKYEYNMACTFYGHLKNLLGRELILQENSEPYSDTEKAWLVYLAIKERLEYRPKHDTLRDNLPWLLYEAREAVAKCTPQEQK